VREGPQSRAICSSYLSYYHPEEASLTSRLHRLAVAVSATKLYVSSYAGNITTLDLTNTNGTYNLAQIDTNNGCAPNASWLHIDAKYQNLYCLDENSASLTNGSLNSFKIDEKSGALTQVKRLATPAAPVNSIIYTSPNGSQLLAVAHYTHGFSTWTLDPATASFAPLQTINFTANPGPKPQQPFPHPHQVRIDPQNKYFVIPDLGADLVRIFYIDPITLLVSPRPSIPVVPGSGPRHGIFDTHGSSNNTSTTYYYLVAEIASTLTSYAVNYLPSNGGLQLTAVTNSTTYGPSQGTTFAYNAASEIALAPGGKTLMVSNRNTTYFNITNPNPKNATLEPSDTMATFDIGLNGTMKFGALSPAGGSFPRQFSLNKKGDLVAVGLQMSGRVVVYGRCERTGEVGNKVLADFEGLGPVTSVVWGESEVGVY